MVKSIVPATFFRLRFIPQFSRPKNPPNAQNHVLPENSLSQRHARGKGGMAGLLAPGRIPADPILRHDAGQRIENAALQGER